MPRPKPEKIDPVDVLGFQLLNPTKIAKAFENFHKIGKTEKEITGEELLAEYDKLGGAIKKNRRLVAMGAFYDFTKKEPKKNLDLDNIGEEDYEDEYVLMRKKRVPEKRVTHKELTAKISALKKEDYEPDEGAEEELESEHLRLEEEPKKVSEEKPKSKRGRPKKNEA